MPENSAPDDDYDFYYMICTKEEPNKIESVCANAKIRITIAEATIRDDSVLRMTNESITLTREYDEPTAETILEIIHNDSFFVNGQDDGINDLVVTIEETDVPTELKGKISLTTDSKLKILPAKYAQ